MDSTHSIVEAIQGACADLGLPVPPAQEAAWVIGLSLESALYRCVPTLTAEQMHDFIDCYRVRFLSRDPGIKLFDGITDLFATIRSSQIALGVATGKRRVGLDRVMAAQNLPEDFHVRNWDEKTKSKQK